MPIPRGWRLPAEQLCAEVEVEQPPARDDQAVFEGSGRGRLLAWGLLVVALAGGLGWSLLRASPTPDEAPPARPEVIAPEARGGAEPPVSDDDVALPDAATAPAEVDGGDEPYVSPSP